MAYKRGDVFHDNWELKVVVLGGPQKYWGMGDYYTVRYLEDKVGLDIHGRKKIVHAKGSTTLMTLAGGQYLYNDPHAAGSSPPSPYTVVYGHCGECDEDEMIFYNDDYICAWCREHFEESIY